MRCGRNLEQTPSLIDADVADDVRSMHAAIGVGRSRRWRPSPRDRLYTAVRLNTTGSSRPMVADTPLPNCAVYWMLFTPVTVSWPPSRNECCCPG